MTRPRFSIIIPSFNQADYLEQAICSVSDQLGHEAELIVMDGGSTDGTAELLTACADQLSHVHSAWDAGPNEAIGRGLRHATGSHIGVLQADDTYEPTALRRVAKAIERAGSADAGAWITGGVISIDAFGDVIDDPSASRPGTSGTALATNFDTADTADTADADALAGIGRCILERPFAGNLSSSFFSRSMLLRAGGFDAALHHDDGLDLALRLHRRGSRPRRVPGTLTRRRRHAMSATASRPLPIARERLDIIEAHLATLPLHQRLSLQGAVAERRVLLEHAARDSGHSDAHADRWRVELSKFDWWQDPRRRAELLASRVFGHRGSDVASLQRAA